MSIGTIILTLAIIFAVTPASARPFYPACLKPDGDWLQGVTRKECIGRDVHGKWITMKQFKRLRNKVL